MKRRIVSVVLALVMLLSFAVIGSAKTYGLVFDSSYDAEKNIVSVTIYVEDPGALEAADFCLAYEPEIYEYVDFSDAGTSSELITAIGKSTLENGLVNCSAMFADSCTPEDLDENGNLMLATFNFKPLTEEYDIENFCMWATSYSINGTDIVAAVTPVGNSALKTSHTAVVTVSPTTSSSSSVKKDSEGNSKWYIYVIAAVVAVGAVAGIAVIAIKNNQDQDEDGENRKKEEKELKEKIDSSDE